jgi:tetratricopeptide (TPR) repeat protein
MNRGLLAVACYVVLSGCAALDGLSGAPASDTARPREPAVASPASPASQSDPPGPELVEERARQAYETGRWDVAEGYYLQWTRLKPGDAAPWFQLGNLYAEQGRLDSAERAYREALRRRDDARTLHNLGLVQIKLGAGALREAQQRLPPDDPARQQTREFLRTLLEAMAR